jgi:hypothetical protein
MFKYSKTHYQHDLSAFTGNTTDTGYEFCKENQEVISCESLEQFMYEDSPYFLGYGTTDSLKAFPLKQFQTLDEAKQHFNFKWHQDVAQLLVDIQYELVDNIGLKYTLMFNQPADWDSFNEFATKNSVKHPHGFKQYGLGIYYSTS